MMALDDDPLHALLDLEAKRVADREIKPAVHDPEAVRRAHHRGRRAREVIVLVHLDVIAILEGIPPRARVRSTSRIFIVFIIHDRIRSAISNNSSGSCRATPTRSAAARTES